MKKPIRISRTRKWQVGPSRRLGNSPSRWLSPRRATPPELLHNGPYPGRGSTMSSTFLSLYFHVVFSTKEREPTIVLAWRQQLHKYLAGTADGLGAHCEIVGGTSDHVHLLVRLNAMHRFADFMRELKRGSSIWVHGDMAKPEFAWQEGYAAFTVSASAVDEVRRYIENQEEHHRERSFREELKILLVRSGVKFDERYLD